MVRHWWKQTGSYNTQNGHLCFPIARVTGYGTWCDQLCQPHLFVSGIQNTTPSFFVFYIYKCWVKRRYSTHWFIITITLVLSYKPSLLSETGQHGLLDESWRTKLCVTHTFKEINLANAPEVGFQNTSFVRGQKVDITWCTTLKKIILSSTIKILNIIKTTIHIF